MKTIISACIAVAVCVTVVTDKMNNEGDKKVSSYFFSKQYHNGCDGHPDLAEHALIAKELSFFISKKMNW